MCVCVCVCVCVCMCTSVYKYVQVCVYRSQARGWCQGESVKSGSCCFVFSGKFVKHKLLKL